MSESLHRHREEGKQRRKSWHQEHTISRILTLKLESAELSTLLLLVKPPSTPRRSTLFNTHRVYPYEFAAAQHAHLVQLQLFISKHRPHSAISLATIWFTFLRMCTCIGVCMCVAIIVAQAVQNRSPGTSSLHRLVRFGLTCPHRLLEQKHFTSTTESSSMAATVAQATPNRAG